MRFQTHIPIVREAESIDYDSHVLLLGSCFSEHIGSKLAYFKWRSLTNPMGVMFHPAAIERLVARAIREEYFTDQDVFEFNGLWQTYEAHTNLSATTRERCLEQLNEPLRMLIEQLSKASHIILTYGSAWGYRHIESGKIVANCHKVSQGEFVKELSSVEEIEKIVQNTFDFIQLKRKDVQIIATVSPVRHLKDGFLENSRSKAHLLSGLHSVIEHIGNTYYFPSYELMMDELRDYRFYTEDMLHPSHTAVEVIWDRFVKAWIDPATESHRKKIDTIQKGLAHRPLHPDTEAHQRFRSNLSQQIETIRQELPFVAF